MRNIFKQIQLRSVLVSILLMLACAGTELSQATDPPIFLGQLPSPPLRLRLTQATDPPVFLGQHLFYLSSYNAIPPSMFDGVRLWATEGTTWRDLQPTSGPFNFSRLDMHIDSALARKMDVLYTLGQTPRWASARPDEPGNMGEGAAAEPKSMDDWAAYVRAVATRYKGKVRAYEVMNEPRIPEAIRPYSPGFFSGTTDKLVQMTKIVHEIVKAEDPMARVICPPMDGAKLGVKRLDYFLSRGGGAYCDVLAFHFYLSTQTVAEMNSLISDLKSIRHKHGLDDLPIWDTEIGMLVAQSGNNVKAREEATGAFSRTFDEKDASSLMLKLILASRLGGIERTYWFAHDSSFMGSTLPNKNDGKLNMLGVGYAQAKFWLSGKQVMNCPVTDEQADCKLLVGSQTAGRIVWGKQLTVQSLMDGNVKTVCFLNGEKYSVDILTDDKLSELTRKYIDPVYLVILQ